LLKQNENTYPKGRALM